MIILSPFLGKNIGQRIVRQVLFLGLPLFLTGVAAGVVAGAGTVSGAGGSEESSLLLVFLFCCSVFFSFFIFFKTSLSCFLLRFVFFISSFCSSDSLCLMPMMNKSSELGLYRSKDVNIQRLCNVGHVCPSEHQLDAILVTIFRDCKAKVTSEAVNDEDDGPGDVVFCDVICEVRQEIKKYFSRDVSPLS